ncbi:MAG TPA: hypothetical protein VN238_16980 [Solirubrobacteraceae bacterium]|nr:hypothetical protein [Solirubrobacteraceae bacterium]
MEGQKKSPPGRLFGRKQGKSPQERSAEFDDIQSRLKQEAADRREAARKAASGEGSDKSGD